MAQKKTSIQLAKLTTYVLGWRPDEFGLVPDPEGFVRIKDFLKAVTEEPGWGYVRRSHIDEILLTVSAPPLEVRDNRIRAAERDRLPAPTPNPELPKHLYVCVREKAYPTVREKGILPTSHPAVVLSASPEMARRMGRRYDAAPVLLTVLVDRTRSRNIDFLQTGELLYLADRIPPDCFSGPPLPKQKPEAAKPKDPEPPRTPGSFYLQIPDVSKGRGSRERRNEIEWKKERRRARKEKGWMDKKFDKGR